MSHLCGLCLALRDDHGQLARTATNYDGLVISVLVDAQRDGGAGHRAAGPCALRGMRRADVAHGEGARLAATVSLVLASAKMRDHADDGDGAMAHRPVAGAARRVAGRWAGRSEKAGETLGFDTAVLVDAAGRQAGVEALAGPGTDILDVTEPTEAATGAAFAHTAVLAGRPGNRAPLEEAGRLFGRLAHLLDAVEDLDEDRRTGAWNPIDATDTPRERVRELCGDAVRGVKLALADVEFATGNRDGRRLTHTLLVHELDEAVRRTFQEPHRHGASCRTKEHRHPAAANPYGPPPGENPYGPPPGQNPGQTPYGPPPGPPEQPEGPHRWHRRNWFAGCGVAALLACTGQMCCRNPFHDPWTGQPREGCCHKCDCGDSCGDCCGDCCCEGCCDCCCCDGC